MTQEKKSATLVVLAAGMGSRYGGLKQLDPVGPNGEAILDYSVYDAMRAGFDKVCFIIRKDFKELFEEKVTSKYKGHIDVDYVFQDLNDLPEGYEVPVGREKPWGTTHAMLATKEVVDTLFAIINADDFYGKEAYETVYKFLSSPKIENNSQAFKNGEPINLAMVGFKLSNTLSENGSVARGICVSGENNYLTSVEELTNIYKTEDGAEDRTDPDNPRELTGDEPVSMNMWGFTPEVYKLLGTNFESWLKENVNVEKSECFIPVEIDNLIKSGKANVEVLATDSKWFGVTYKEDKPEVVASIQALIDKGLYPEVLFK